MLFSPCRKTADRLGGPLFFSVYWYCSIRQTMAEIWPRVRVL